jgi:hypothetical protein
MKPTNKQTNKQIPSQAKSLTASPDISYLLWDPNFIYRVHKNPRLDNAFSQIKPIHILILYSPRPVLVFSSHLHPDLQMVSFVQFSD